MTKQKLLTYAKHALIWGGAVIGIIQTNLTVLQPLLPPKWFNLLAAVVPITFGLIQFIESEQKHETL